jgi:hypothetical protein
MPLILNIEEYGLIENLTAISFAMASGLALIIFIRQQKSIWACFSFLMCMACMRELDLHKYWTTDSILKSRFYLSVDTPFIEKIIGATVILSLILCGIYLLRHIPAFIINIREKQKTALAFLCACGLIVTSKFFDAMSRILPALKPFHKTHASFFKGTEESFELIAAVLFLSLCLLKIRQKPLARHE